MLLTATPLTSGLISIGIIDVASANEALMEVMGTAIHKNSRLVMVTLDIFNVIPLFNLIIIYVICSKISNLFSPRLNDKYPYLLKAVLTNQIVTPNTQNTISPGSPKYMGMDKSK